MTLKIKLFLADSYSLFLEGLSIILSKAELFEVVGCSYNQKELLVGLKLYPCDILIIDYNLLFQGNISFLQDLKHNYSNKVLVLYDSRSLNQLKKIQSGVDGFLSKESNSQDLHHKIKLVFQGKKNTSTTRNKYVYSRTPLQEEVLTRYKLTNRELEVIKLIALEFSSVEIAHKLCVSEFTIDTYLKNIARKLNARNVVSIVNFAHRWELI